MTQKTTVTLAQISDVHLPFPNWPPLRMWNVKRALGLLNWVRGRRSVHRFEAVDLMLADMKAQTPDHIAVTGDLVNLGLPQEYRAALSWLQVLGPPETVSVIPGNHDIYCPVDPDDDCRTLWSSYMQSDAVGRDFSLRDGAQFPFMRRIGPVVLIGANSALPTRPFIAHGIVGDVQLQAIENALRYVAKKGLFSCLMLHHPPLPGQTAKRRALVDADKMVKVIRNNPVGLVIYGHNHVDAITWIDNTEHQNGKLSVCGAASGSAYRRHKREPLARYYLYTFCDDGGRMSVERLTRGLNETRNAVVEIDRIKLSPT